MKKLLARVGGVLIVLLALCLLVWPEYTISAVRRAGTQIFNGKIALTSSAYLTRLRVGTGSTPGLTIDDDDVFIEGSLEVDGAVQFDGAITYGAGAIFQSDLFFEGATADAFETKFAITDPTADQVLTFPNDTGAVMISGLTTNSPQVTNSIWGASQSIIAEGTADTFETTLLFVDATADVTVKIPDAGGTIALSTLDLNKPDLANGVWLASSALVFEGLTADGFETNLTITDPTVGDKTITLPNASGTVMLSALAANGADLVNSVTGISDGLIFEGTTADLNETSLIIGTDPAADVTLKLPNTTGTLAMSTLDLNGPDIANSVWLASSALVFEGLTANDFEISLIPADTGADVSITLPAATGAVMLSTLLTNAPDVLSSVTGGTNQLIFEGTADAFETILTATDATVGDKTVTFADASGTVMLSSLAANGPQLLNSIWGDSLSIVSEGVADDFETTLLFANAAADISIKFADAAGTIAISTLDLNAPNLANGVWLASSALVFEALTANDFEGSIVPVDVTADRTYTLPDGSGAVMLSTLLTNAPDIANSVTGVSDGITFEGATGGADAFETTILLGTDPTADVTLKLPDASGTFCISTLDLNKPELANGVWLASSALVFEALTANDFEGSIIPADFTADRSFTLPDAGGTFALSTLATNAPEVANSIWLESDIIAFEGTVTATAETRLTITDPGADVTITFPAYTGDVPVVVTQDATSRAATNQTTDGTSISVPQSVFGAGTALRFSCAGTIAGGNAAKSLVMYIDNAAIVTLTTAAAIVGDYTFDCVIAEHTGFANQKVFCKAQTGSVEYLTDYATDTTNFAADVTTVKTQVISGHAADTITQEFCLVEFLP